MALLTFDAERCTRCGRCVKVCPTDVLLLEDDASAPVVVDPEHCIGCGHCIAVCAADAVTHQGLRPEAFAPVGESRISPDQMTAFLKSKRSIRRYTDEPVAREVIERLIAVARNAPTGKNAQSCGFIVVTDAVLIREIECTIAARFRRLASYMNPVVRGLVGLVARDMARGMARIAPALKALARRVEAGGHPVFRGAPCAIFIHAPRSALTPKDDCVAAQHYLMMQAHAEGLGTCIIGYAQAVPKTVARLLPMPKNHRLHAALIVGHPAVPYVKTIDRRPARVEWL